MSATTGISWADRTWNPLAGCSHVSPGCDNCYAARDASTRLRHLPLYAGLTDDAGRFNGTIHTAPDRLDDPLRWRKPTRVFVNSMSDLFHRGLDGDYLAEVLGVMAAADQHVFQVLTKRPKDMLARLTNDAFLDDVDTARLRRRPTIIAPDWPRPNWWLGVSVENRQYLWRLRVLRQVPAAVRWVSFEPLLGRLTAAELGPFLACTCGHERGDHAHGLPGAPCALACPCQRWDGIDWVVVGGESGAAARPVDPGWVREILEVCQGHGIPFHFKQWGKWVPYEPTADLPFWLGQDGREVDAHEFPADLTEGRPTYGWWAPLWVNDDGTVDPTVFRSCGGTALPMPKPQTLDGVAYQEYPAP